MVTPVTSVAAQTAAITVTGLDDPSLVFLSYNPTARTISGTAPDTVVARSPRTITATVAGGNTVTFTIAIQAVRNPEITGLPRFIAVLTGTSLPRNALSYSVQGDDYLPIVSFTGMPAGLAESQATSSVDQYRVEGNINGTLANSFRAGRVLQVTLTATGAGLTSTHPFGICIFGDHLTIRGDRDTPILNNIPHHALPSGRPYQAFLAGLTIKNVPGDLTLTVTEKPDWLSELTTISQTINGTGNNVRFNLASVVLDGDTPAVTVQTTYRVSYRVDSTDGRTASHSFNIRVTPVSN